MVYISRTCFPDRSLKFWVETKEVILSETENKGHNHLCSYFTPGPDICLSSGICKMKKNITSRYKNSKHTIYVTNRITKMNIPVSPSPSATGMSPYSRVKPDEPVQDDPYWSSDVSHSVLGQTLHGFLIFSSP